MVKEIMMVICASGTTKVSPGECRQVYRLEDLPILVAGHDRVKLVEKSSCLGSRRTVGRAPHLDHFVGDPVDNDDCLVWTGAKNSRGYGHMRFCGRTVRVHRVVAMFCFGPLPPASVVMHKCDNPLCYKVEHLSVGTQKQNIADMIAKGRTAFVGEANHRRKLSRSDVIEIRKSRMSGKALAGLYGVSNSCISEIRSGKKWASV